MKRKIATVLLALSLSPCMAQDFGLSFSYFIPRNGYFSTPVSPFSIRGLGVDLNRFVALETGASLYRMAGLNLKDVPFESKEPLVGPNFTLFVPVELVLQLKGSPVSLDIKGGIFGFYGFSQKLNYGNMDRAIRQYEQWQVANSRFSFSNKPGWGYHAGAELTLNVTQQVGVSLETNYLIGQSAFALAGSYTGGNDVLITREVSFPDAAIDFTGLEVSIGIIFSSNTGNRKPGRKRR
jgi:hypothetical protein